MATTDPDKASTSGDGEGKIEGELKNTDENAVTNVKNLVHGTRIESEGGKSLWRVSLETMRIMDGNDAKQDVLIKDEAEAMEAFKSLVKGQTEPKWKCSLTPFRLVLGNDGTDQSKNMDKLMRSFLLWSKKDHDQTTTKEDDDTKFNISKAFRRMESYVTWMDDNKETLEKPVDLDDLVPLSKIWNMKLTYDVHNRLVWWVDAGTVKFDQVKKLPLDQSLIFLVWMIHVVMLDEKAQENGMILVRSLGDKGFSELINILPSGMATKMKRLFTGALPIKMKKFYMMQYAGWLNIFIMLLKPFMSKKMRSRINLLGNKDPQPILDQEIGRECIPVKFATLEGKAETDLIQTLLDEQEAEA